MFGEQGEPWIGTEDRAASVMSSQSAGIQEGSASLEQLTAESATLPVQEVVDPFRLGKAREKTRGDWSRSRDWSLPASRVSGRDACKRITARIVGLPSD